MLQNRFFAFASRSGFGAAISDAAAPSSIVLCDSVSADRKVAWRYGCSRNAFVFCSWTSSMYVVKIFLRKYICVSSFCVQKPCALNALLCKRLRSKSKIFLACRKAEMS